MKRLLLVFLVALTGAFAGAGIYSYYFEKHQPLFRVAESAPAARFAGYDRADGAAPDFVYAAGVTTPAVVHIRSKYDVQASQHGSRGNNPFRDYFGDDFWFYGRPDMPRQPREQFGSGVIISADGYIATNNHVVKDAEELEVTLHDNRTFRAEVIGTDPSTDIALIKIDEKNLSFITFGNSDEVKVGEWVLAVGNPFNLASTVTAGIVSAKGRNLHLLDDRYAIESFIQTDAAVNPGNSGGALVNLRGELVGINTAIATPTGTYAGYSFAVPVNIVRRVVEDLTRFGSVKRAYLGVTIRNVNSELAKEKDLGVTEGVYVDSVLEGSAGAAGGIRAGDVITKIDNAPVTTAPQLQEMIAMHRPGDEVSALVNRKGKEITLKVNLKDLGGEVSRLTSENKAAVTDALGADLEELSEKEIRGLGLEGGVRVTGIRNGRLRQFTNIREGFIITRINGKAVKSVDDIAAQLAGRKGSMASVEGRYPNSPMVYYYGFVL